MSKARPHAHIYEKWVRGIRKAVPNEAERCGLYEYFIDYQLAKVYGAVEMPDAQVLSPAAAVAFACYEGDLDELCEVRKLLVERNKVNGLKGRPQQTPADPSGGEMTPTIQSNTIQDKTIQSNINAKQVLADLATDGEIQEFDLGLALLYKGYLVKAGELHSLYARAAQKEHPVAYAAKAMVEADPSVRAGLAVAANFVKATGCRDTRALEVYGASIASDDGTPILNVRCTPAAREVLSKASKANIADYLETCGADRVEYFCNGQ